MAPNPRNIPPFLKPEHKAIPSAVLILLFENLGQYSFFLTKRSYDVEHHRGQISLPGGAQERDESLERTALRETEEEIGISASSINILGSLTPLFIPASGFRVTPFVGCCRYRVKTDVDKNEVASLHVVRVEELLNNYAVGWEKRTIRSIEVDVPFFTFDRLKVWGATASILSECKDIFVDCYEMEKKL